MRFVCIISIEGQIVQKKNPLWGVCALVCAIGYLLSTIPRRWKAAGNVYSVPSTYGLKCPIFVHWVGTMPVWDTCAYNQERGFIWLKTVAAKAGKQTQTQANKSCRLHGATS